MLVLVMRPSEVGVGVGVGSDFGVSIGVGAALVIGVGELEGTTSLSPIITFVNPQSVIKVFNVLASALSTVKSNLHLTAIQLDT